MKVGGGCLRDAKAFLQLPILLRQAYPDAPRLLVVSAIGKTTNHLLAIAQAASRPDTAQVELLFQRLRTFHEEIIEALLPSSQKLKEKLHERYWRPLWQRIQTLLQLPEEGGPAVDAILVYGELISSEIVHAYLEVQGFTTEWIDARQLIVTDGSYPEPNVLLGPSQANVDAQLLPLFRRSPLVVTQGYIASDLRRRSVTLGREGSDYSAALFASMLKAQGMIAWKDVGHIYSADPHKYAEAQPIPHLSYQQAAEMTYYGAQVLHPRTLQPLQEKNIPLYIRPYFNPSEVGTVINEKVAQNLPPIRTHRKGLSLIEVQSLTLSRIDLEELLHTLHLEGIEPYFLQTSVHRVALAVQADPELLERWQANAPPYWEVKMHHPIVLHTILHPSPDSEVPNGESLYLQRSPRGLHWIAYET